MLSRVAERLYWFSRYIERTENMARLILVRHQLILDLPAKIQPGWDILTNMLGATQTFKKVSSKPTEKNVVAFVFGAKDNPGSIISSLAFARENIRTTREIMPMETWERVNSLYLSVAQRANKDLARNVRFKVLNDIVQRCQQISGMLSGSMAHGDAYQFLRIGRNLERADMSSRIIDAGSAPLLGGQEDIQPYKNSLWISVLKSLSAEQMYRQFVQRNVQPKDVLDFLMHNVLFPRALAHTLNELEKSMASLPHNKEPLAAIAVVKKSLSEADLENLKGSILHNFIDGIQMQLIDINQCIAKTWFSCDLPDGF